jgi:hypothetical protein
MATDTEAAVRARAICVAATARSRAPAAAVFALLKDGTTWPDWTMFDAFELERPGNEEPMGLGAIRVFSTALSRAREEIVELVPDRRLSYILLSGFPFNNYRADVDLSPRADGGTSIDWRASFEAKYPGTGWFWRLFMTAVLRKVASDLASAADARALRA